jgi:hypothetical protein
VGAVKTYAEHGFEVPTEDGVVLEGTTDPGLVAQAAGWVAETVAAA